MATIEELKKLSPQERIRCLRELEEERRKEIEQAEELIKETSREIAEAEEKRKIPIPQARATDLSSALTTAEEKQLVATHHLMAEGTPAAPAAPEQQPKSLEEVAAEEALPAQAQQPQQNLFGEKGLSKTQQFERPAYAISGEQRKSAFTEYARASEQSVTGGGGVSGPASQIEDKVTEFYRQRAIADTEPTDTMRQSYKSETVSGGYEARNAEGQQRKQAQEFYSKGAP
ncbi:hypothetical protein HYU17_02055 [Candidatus Woesearchaeota archaeon]|nr:hypothetical protein [Candidatus Woesearchaeota archaeon]